MALEYVRKDLVHAYLQCGQYKALSADVINGLIEQIPTADVRENVHGHWIDTSPPPVEEGRLPEWFEYTCSACGKGRVIAMTPFCYFCGAKMDNYGKMKGTKNDGKK